MNAICQTVYIAHADCGRDAAFLSEKIKESGLVKSVEIDFLESVIGAHTGIGGVAVFFLGNY